MKVESIQDAERRYGEIDLASGHWAGSSQWIQVCRIPNGWFPNWKVLNTDHPVSIISCNADIHTTLLDALALIRSRGQGHLLKTYDGCFNIRAVRGGNQLSAHAYGLAIDINAATNKLGDKEAEFFKCPELVKCFRDVGFSWGGEFKRVDAMHFSLCWE